MPVTLEGGTVSLHVLLVEDDELLRGLTGRIVRGLGHKVYEVADGADAMAALTSDGTFDVVFTDVKLGGGLDGMALARRALETSDQLRVVLTSGDPSTFRASDSLGPRVATLAKPYRKDQIQRVLDTIAERHSPMT